MVARKGDFILTRKAKVWISMIPIRNGGVYLPTGLNWAQWEDKEFLKLHEQQRVELDKTKRGQILRKMADIIRDSHVFIFETRPQVRQTWWSFIMGFVAPNSFYQTSYRWDHMWIDK